MSKKASIIYLSFLTVFFLVALGLIVYGSIFYLKDGEIAQFPLMITVVGLILFFLVLVAIAVTTISSNYVKKNPHKDPKKNQ